MWSEKLLKKLVAEGKIRGYRISAKSKKPERKKFLLKFGKEKYWIEINLQAWCEKHDVNLVPEYQFMKDRKFRFDWSVPSIKLAVEYEGIFSKKSRHTTVEGYSRDAEKYNAAAGLGWRVLRYTAKTYKNLLEDLKQCG